MIGHIVGGLVALLMYFGCGYALDRSVGVKVFAKALAILFCVVLFFGSIIFMIVGYP